MKQEMILGKKYEIVHGGGDGNQKSAFNTSKIYLTEHYCAKFLWKYFQGFALQHFFCIK